VNTIGDTSVLDSYTQPSTSGIMLLYGSYRQIVKPHGTDHLGVSINVGSGHMLYMGCQHTLDIPSNIFSLVETCNDLNYDLYKLTCDRNTNTSSVLFQKSGAPGIIIMGTYTNHMPFISISTETGTPFINIVSYISYPTTTEHTTSPRLLDEPTITIHQVFGVITDQEPTATQTGCPFNIIQLFQEKITDKWTPCGMPVLHVLHIIDAVNGTLWHVRTCHPNPEGLVKVSEISRGILKLEHPQAIEQCSNCLISKRRTSTIGHCTPFIVSVVGQGLTFDVGFVFQSSKNFARSKIFIGINGKITYCTVYDLFSELVFGITMCDKSLPMDWIYLPPTRISPRSTPRQIFRLDLGEKTGKNP
jgi:hypothetical protein